MTADRRPPRLVLVNGLPGSGKSTAARRYAAGRPDVVVLDVDALRVDEPDPVSVEAGLRARDRALAAARPLLLAGRDVLVPQFIARTPFLNALEALAAATGAVFVQVLLDGRPADVLPRLAARAASATRPEHALAARILDRSGGPDSLRDKHDRLRAFVAARPATHVLDATARPDEVDAAMRRALDG